MYDVIIVGGSYAGLSAAMALGRSLRNVLVIDSNQPCNRFTPHSHNFITHDGSSPEQISAAARQQVEQYATVKFYNGLAKLVETNDTSFTVITSDGVNHEARKLILATGLKDIMPDIPGFAECWGKSIIHCPYCHGYEFRKTKTGIFANGDIAYHYAQLVSNLTKDLTIFTNGKAEFSEEQLLKIKKNKIPVVESKIKSFIHDNGELKGVVLEENTEIQLDALYARPIFEQHSDIVGRLGCKINDHGLIEVDPAQKTTVPGVFACGDNSGMRAVSVAVASGTKAGAMVNFELTEESF